MLLVKAAVWLVFLMAAVIWAIPFTIVGLVLVATGFGAPFGAGLLLIGGYPLSRMFRRAL